MVKAYILNKNGKIELTLEELQKLLEEAEAEGKRLAGQPSIIAYHNLNPIPTSVVKKVEIGDVPPYTPFTCQVTTTSTAETHQKTAGDIKAEG